MTEHDDRPWGPDDDELVRTALMSLMDDVSTHPLPEPEAIRARGEGHDAADVVDLDLRRRRRRSFAYLAGAAAAALIATSAGAYLANQSPDTPVAGTSTTPTSTGSTTSSVDTRLQMLSRHGWEAVLGAPVASTTTTIPEQTCFEPTDDASWTTGSALVADDTIAATQWIGAPRPDSEPLTQSVEDTLRRCDDRDVELRSGDDLPDGAGYRAWRAVAPDGDVRWWVEVTDGQALSFLAFSEGDRSYDDADLRQLARAVLGEIELTPETSTTPATTTTGTTEAPTTTETAPATTTGTATGTAAPDPSATTGGTGTATPSGTSAPSLPSVSVVGPIEAKYYVPDESWSSPALTGGAATTWGPLELEGPPYIRACTSVDSDVSAWAMGVRSGPGDDNYFGRQHIMLTDQADRAYDELLSGYASGTCPGPAIGGTVTQLAPTVFRIVQGDHTYYVAVVRMRSDGVSVLHLAQAKTAPQPLTDSVAVSELQRLSGLAAQR